MCNITLIDCADNLISAKDVRQLITINNLLGNADGFGYMLFSDQEVVKTKEEAITYWKDNYKDFLSKENINGIYHVRKSSVTTSSGWNGVVYVTKENNNISDDKSHPFNYNDIIVAHNGFLSFRHTHINAEKFEKLLVGDLIDSQKFAIVLSSLCNKGTVKIENIKDALNMFGGAYCLAIKGKKDNNVWLCRGKDRTLYAMKIFYKDNPVGIIVNTTPMGLIVLGDLLTTYDYTYDLKEFKENTIYSYELNSFDIKEVTSYAQDSTYETTHTKTYVTIPSTRGDTVKVNDNIYEDIFDIMYEMGFFIHDIVILSELVMGKSIFIFDDDDFLKFSRFLDKLFTEETHTSRMNIWNELQKYKDGSVFNLYKHLYYPFMLNSKDELKTYLHKLETSRKDNRNELAIIQ